MVGTDVPAVNFGTFSDNDSVVIIVLGAFGNKGILRIGSVGFRQLKAVEDDFGSFCLVLIPSSPLWTMPTGKQRDELILSYMVADSSLAAVVEVEIVVIGS